MRGTGRRLSFLALALALASCSGTGGDEPPASFAGVWALTSTNSSTATYVHCTGYLTFLEGLHADGSRDEIITCYAEATPVIQSGSTVTLTPAHYSCDDGDYGSIYGGGTVDGKHIDYTENTSSDYNGTTFTDKYTGTKTSATTFVLDEWRWAVSGPITGSCNLSPKLRYDGAIVDTALAAPERREVPSAAIRGRLRPKLIESIGKR